MSPIAQLEPLHKVLAFQIIAAPSIYLRDFAGVSRTKHYATSLTDRLAEDIVSGLSNYRFYELGRQVEEQEIVVYVMERLLAVPEEIASGCGAKKFDDRKIAVEVVALLLERALLSKWSMEYASKNRRPLD